jgi:hypothetical protein
MQSQIPVPSPLTHRANRNRATETEQPKPSNQNRATKTEQPNPSNQTRATKPEQPKPSNPIQPNPNQTQTTLNPNQTQTTLNPKQSNPILTNPFQSHLIQSKCLRKCCDWMQLLLSCSLLNQKQDCCRDRDSSNYPGTHWIGRRRMPSSHHLRFDYGRARE